MTTRSKQQQQQQQQNVPKKKQTSLFTIILGVWFTLFATAALFTLTLVLHYGLVNVFTFSTRYDSQLREHLLKANDPNHQLQFHIPTSLPISLVKSWNTNVINSINSQQTFLKLPHIDESHCDAGGRVMKLSISWLHVPMLAVFVAFLFTFLSKYPALIAQTIEGKGVYDNNHPRNQQARLTGWGARAIAGHQNAIEAFAPFAASVILYIMRFGLILVTVHNVDASVLLIKECTIFIVSRCLYHVFYWLNLSLFRSLSWALGFSVVVNLFIQTFKH